LYTPSSRLHEDTSKKPNTRVATSSINVSSHAALTRCISRTSKRPNDILRLTPCACDMLLWHGNRNVYYHQKHEVASQEFDNASLTNHLRSLGPLGLPGSPWVFLNLPGSPWVPPESPLGFPGSSLVHLGPSGSPWIPLNPTGSPWVLLGPPNPPWVPLGLPGFSWVALGPLASS